MLCSHLTSDWCLCEFPQLKNTKEELYIMFFGANGQLGINSGLTEASRNKNFCIIIL